MSYVDVAAGVDTGQINEEVAGRGQTRTDADETDATAKRAVGWIRRSVGRSLSARATRATCAQTLSARTDRRTTSR